MLKRLATLLTLLTALFLFNACDDAPPITKTIIDEILTEPIPVNQSRYTGKLHPVGTLIQFGSHTYSPDALEWDGTDLYMIAESGRNTRAAKYLFKVDKETGRAIKVNTGAHNLGGTFSGGRGFTQVGGVSPNDMTWHPEGIMLATCPILDRIVKINLQTGFAERISKGDDFCLRYPEGDTDFDKEFGGYKVIGSGTALAYTDTGLYMWGISRRNKALARKGWRNFGAFYRIEDMRCATPIGEPIFFGTGPEDMPPDPEGHEPYAYTLCYDGQNLYMSGAHTNGLYIIDQTTGTLTFVEKWHVSEAPAGHSLNESGMLTKHSERSTAGIWVTGLAFDGQTMYAVCGFTDALYKLEKR